VRHSGARTASIGLARRGGELSLEVRDDGRGHAGATPSGTGLRGMSERLGADGGRLELRPIGSPGFRLVATVPAGGGASSAGAAAETGAGGASGAGGRAAAAARKSATVTE